MVEILKYFNTGDVVSGDVTEKVSSDFHEIDLSFVRPNELNSYVKFKNSMELSQSLFSLLDNEKLEVSAFPLIGCDKIKWYDKSIEKGEVLFALLDSNLDNSPVVFVGVSL